MWIKTTVTLCFQIEDMTGEKLLWLEKNINIRSQRVGSQHQKHQYLALDLGKFGNYTTTRGHGKLRLS